MQYWNVFSSGHKKTMDSPHEILLTIEEMKIMVKGMNKINFKKQGSAINVNQISCLSQTVSTMRESFCKLFGNDSIIKHMEYIEWYILAKIHKVYAMLIERQRDRV